MTTETELQLDAAVERMLEATARLHRTPIVDDDYPEMRHLHDSALGALRRAHAATRGVAPPMNLVEHLARQAAWSCATFGPGDRAKGVVDHIRKELLEIEAAPGDLMEWIDVAILAFDGAWRTGATPQEIAAALVAKQARNEGRIWPDWRTAEPGKAIEHDRTGEKAADCQWPDCGHDTNGSGSTCCIDLTTKPVGYAEPLWCLHIQGPDDVHPAPSKAKAEEAAEAVNTFMRSRVRSPDPMDPVVTAVATLWPHSPESHAAGLADFEANWLRPGTATDKPYPLAPATSKRRASVVDEALVGRAAAAYEAAITGTAHSPRVRNVALRAALAAVVTDLRPADDDLWDQTLQERDGYHDIADELAAEIAAITGTDIGEHSSANFPWQNALEAAEAHRAAAAAAQPAADPECHCATCTCRPGMTPSIRYDVTPALRETAIQDHLVEMGWRPPAVRPTTGDDLADVAKDAARRLELPLQEGLTADQRLTRAQGIVQNAIQIVLDAQPASIQKFLQESIRLAIDFDGPLVPALRAMAASYGHGHEWDYRDSKIVLAAADHIVRLNKECQQHLHHVFKHSETASKAEYEVERLNAIINTPHSDDFIRAVSIEAEHQRQRWPAQDDASKTPADWFWLVGYLAGKALHQHAAGNTSKAEHHIITTAAACANWHRSMFGLTDMQPASGEVIAMVEPAP